MDLKDRIEARLAELGITARDAERAAGLPRNAIGDILAGRKRGLNAERAPAVAAALEWSLGELLGERGGLAEPEVRPLTREAGRAGVWQLLAPEAKHPLAVLLAEDLPGAGLLAGDELIYDANGLPDDGDIVIAQVVDEVRGSARMLVRRLWGRGLYPLGARGGAPHMLGGADSVQIVGPVLAVCRRDLRSV